MIKKKNNLLTKSLIIICSLLLCVASVFCFVNKSSNNNLIVSADSVVDSFTFEGSNFSTPSYCYYNNTYYSSLSSFTFDFSSENSVVTRMSLTYSSYFIFDLFGGLSIQFEIPLDDIDGDYIYTYNDYTIRIPYSIVCSNYSNGLITMGKPIRLEMYYDNVPWDDNFGRNILSYYDVNDNFISVVFYFDITDFPYGSENPDDMIANAVFWKTRTYYLTNSFSDNEYYNQGYTAGSSIGYGNGYNSGLIDGYNDGYSVGNNVGYNAGFSEGVESANNYTFLSLISSVIDAPIKYFQSLFNFELLGVNLQGFLTGLFTLCVIVTIVKMFL